MTLREPAATGASTTGSDYCTCGDGALARLALVTSPGRRVLGAPRRAQREALCHHPALPAEGGARRGAAQQGENPENRVPPRALRPKPPNHNSLFTDHHQGMRAPGAGIAAARPGLYLPVPGTAAAATWPCSRWNRTGPADSFWGSVAPRADSSEACFRILI